MDKLKGKFPFSSNGFWHSGIHIQGTEEDCFSNDMPGELMKFRKEDAPAYPSAKDVNSINKYDLPEEAQEKSFYSKGVENNIGYLDFKGLTEEERRELFDRLGISMDSSYVILKHEIRAKSSNFDYYTLYMHLKNVKSYEKNTFLLPKTSLGNYGNSQGEENIVHVEVFTNKELGISVNYELASDILQDYCIFPNEQTVYSLKEQTATNILDLPTYTILNIQEHPAEFPNSLKVNIDRIPAKIDMDFLAEKRIIYRMQEMKNEEDKVIDIKPYVESLEEDSDILTEEKIKKSQDIAIQVLVFCKNGEKEIEIKKEVSIKDITCFELKDKLDLKIYCLIPFAIVKSDFDSIYGETWWIKTDSKYVKQGIQKNGKDKSAFVRTIKSGTDTFSNSKLEVYNYPPDKKIIVDSTLKKIGKDRFYETEIKKIITLSAGDGGFADKQLYKISSDEKTIYVDSIGEVSGNEWEDLKNDTITFTSDKTERVSCISPQIFFSDLKKMFSNDTRVRMKDEENLEKYYFLNKDTLRRCGFQIDSDWIQKQESHAERYFSFIKSLWDRICIWKSNHRNTRMPKGLKDSFDFVFYNYDYFLGRIRRIHAGYAAKLRKVQDEVMSDWRMFQGNRGIYNNYNSESQTFCNQAVYETIKHVDGEYLKFLMDIDEPAWNVAKYKCLHLKKEECDNCKEGKDFFSFLNKRKNLKDDNYKYKPSNLWCDVLEYQAANSRKTGIHRIAAEQAFYMAQLGYVVIAAWKNISDSNPPHFVTVRPCEGEYPGLESLLVAHVGRRENEEKFLEKAFLDEGNNTKKYKEVLFYCNVKQIFI